MRRPDDDAVRDALALIEASHRGDLEAARCLLDHGDVRVIACFLASVCDDLIGDLAEWRREDPAAMLGVLREHHTGARP